MKPSLQNEFVNILRRHEIVDLGIVFGSVASGRETEASDLDMAVAASRPLTVQEKIGLIEELAMACGRPVDLVDLNRETGLILHQALTRGTVLVNQNPVLYARLMLRMLYDQADMMPMRTMINRARLKAFAHG